MEEQDEHAFRLKKLEYLKKKGIDPYPSDSRYTHTISVIRDDFNNFLKDETEVVIDGRIMSVRKHGGSMFLDLFDGTGKIQIFLKKDNIGEDSFDLFNEAIDKSDFIEIVGTAFLTKKEEPTILASSWRLLSKSLRPIPDEWYGLKDVDERFRKRYIDMLLNPEVADIVRQRSVFWNTIRTFMLERGYLEVETPILETKTGGAEARPFITHHNALDMDVYLRISHELWHKKLVIGGIPKVFEIGRIFRNEGMSYEHAQDYTHFEFYEAYLNAEKGVQMVVDLYRTVAEKTFGTLQFNIHGFDVDLSKEWGTYNFSELMKDSYDFDPLDVDLKVVLEHLDKEGISYEKGTDIGRGVDLLWKKIRKTIGGPAILTGIPVYLEPLAKKNKDDSRVVDRFQILLGGSELGKAFNELNDPIDQRERFEQQQALRDAGDEEAQMADYEYVEALEHGMPPVFGFGVSERLFSFLSGKSIRETQLFPLMRPKD